MDPAVNIIVLFYTKMTLNQISSIVETLKFGVLWVTIFHAMEIILKLQILIIIYIICPNSKNVFKCIYWGITYIPKSAEITTLLLSNLSQSGYALATKTQFNKIRWN